LGSMCDCKYGKNNDSPTNGEYFNGCPEIRMAKELIEVMTDKEFARLCNRAKIIAT